MVFMLTNKDIDKLIKVFATKEDIRAIHERLNRMDATLQGLLTGVDKLVKAFDELSREYAAMSEQLTRHERWIKQIARKAGVVLAE